MNKVIFGDCRESMRKLIADGVKVQMCVTSPPYWNLRDYGHSEQLGLEPIIAKYLANQVEVFSLVWDLLADDGTIWVNMGDSYTNGGRTTRDPGHSKLHPSYKRDQAKPTRRPDPAGLAGKNLIGQPWRLAFALQEAGWILRQDIIWHKPNPMPESVGDRCTKSHEYVFLLSKSQKYYFDQDAIKEPASQNTHARQSQQKTPDGWDTSKGNAGHGGFHKEGREKGRKLERVGSGTKNNESFDKAMAVMPEYRNKRAVWNIEDHNALLQWLLAEHPEVAAEYLKPIRPDVWTVATQPYSEAHFATFPPALIEPCILAGSKMGDIVLDPFFGSGTTGQVAQNLGRQWLGLEINEEYEPLQKKRTSQMGFKL